MKTIICFLRPLRQIIFVAVLGLLAVQNSHAGLTTEIPNLIPNFSAPAFPILSAVPEPSSYALMALGLAGISWLRRNKRR